ncbi:hypothetical protein VNO80_03760 [Phaseolus coccineus]|uniref:Uncharacterized protein n=1 Tax=Phaseolus coccineus TaxID=3886 RepID=A0AAN9RMT8_PHACN
MGNKTSSNAKVHGQVTRVVSTEPDYEPRMGRSAAKYIAKPKAETVGTWKRQHGSGVYADNTPLDNDETFTTFIRHAKYKIRSASHMGREQSNVAPAPESDDEEANGRDNQNKEFSDFIQSAKKKLRSSSSKRKNGSFKRG